MKSKNPKWVERRVRNKPGACWFTLMPFKSNEILTRWTIVTQRTNP